MSGTHSVRRETLASWSRPTLTRLGKAHRSHTLRKGDWLPQLEQRNVMVVSVNVEVTVPDDGRYGAHDGRRLWRLVLVVVAEEHPNLGAFQPVDPHIVSYTRKVGQHKNAFIVTHAIQLSKLNICRVSKKWRERERETFCGTVKVRLFGYW
jgi:hypothetical protein